MRGFSFCLKSCYTDSNKQRGFMKQVPFKKFFTTGHGANCIAFAILAATIFTLYAQNGNIALLIVGAMNVLYSKLSFDRIEND